MRYYPELRRGRRLSEEMELAIGAARMRLCGIAGRGEFWGQGRHGDRTYIADLTMYIYSGSKYSKTMTYIAWLGALERPGT